MNKQFLFVCGCARSGTTALAQFLNYHPSIFLGSERYLGILQREKKITPDLYEPERFLDVRPRDTHYKSLDALPIYRKARERYPLAHYVGDKLPKLCRYYEQVAEEFPGAKFICIVRNLIDVARSFKRRANDPDDRWSRGVEKAIEEWNMALHTSLDFLATGKLLVLEYENLLLKGVGTDRIGAFLELDFLIPADKLRHSLEIRSERSAIGPDILTEEEKSEIEEHGDFVGYRRLLELSLSIP